MHCRNSHAFGWVGVFVFVVIVLIGAYILPIVLVGIIYIKFNEASTKSDTAKLIKSRTKEVISSLQHELPFFFTNARMNSFRQLFNSMWVSCSHGGWFNARGHYLHQV